MSLNFRDCHAKIRQVDSQATVGNAVVVQVNLHLWIETLGKKSDLKVTTQVGLLIVHLKTRLLNSSCYPDVSVCFIFKNMVGLCKKKFLMFGQVKEVNCFK